MVISTFLSVQDCILRLKELDGDHPEQKAHYAVEVNGVEFSFRYINRGRYPKNNSACVVFRGSLSEDSLTNRTRIEGSFSRDPLGVSSLVFIIFALLVWVALMVANYSPKDPTPDLVLLGVAATFGTTFALAPGAANGYVADILMKTFSAKLEKR